MSNELYLATTVDGIEIEVEVYEGQRTVVVPGRGSFTLPRSGCLPRSAAAGIPTLGQGWATSGLLAGIASDAGSSTRRTRRQP